MMQHDLFSYPHTPGYRDTDTSKQAANDMIPLAGTIRNMVLNVLDAAGLNGLTAIEASVLLGMSYESVQPRMSELKAKGLIIDSGKRRASRNPDKLAIVWSTIMTKE